MQDPNLLKLMRLMGVAHIVAFSIGAIVGDISRFAKPKKLVAYLGLNPGLSQSGKHAHTFGLCKHGRRDLRGLLVQSAQNILQQRKSPLHQWGWRLFLKKGNKKIAVVAVARKLAVQIWYLLQGRFTKLKEPNKTLVDKITKVATVIGKEDIIAMGYPDKATFQREKLKIIMEPS